MAATGAACAIAATGEAKAGEVEIEKFSDAGESLGVELLPAGLRDPVELGAAIIL